MRVFFCEKPSVAKEVASALGSGSRQDGFWTTSAGDIITFGVGHLIGLSNPEDHNPAWKTWSLDSLPMIPDDFKYSPYPKTLDQLKTAAKLFRDKKVTEIVNACDAGREGELIFWLVYNYAGATAPVKRLWVSSLTRDALLTGIRSLKPASAYQGLKDASFLRQTSDWLVGLNATRAMTLKVGQSGEVFSLGRVQTPTLKLIVDRDNTIDQFVPVPFFVLVGSFSQLTPGGESFDANHCTDSLEVIKFDSLAECDSLRSRLLASGKQPFVKDVRVKPHTLKQPLLFDLTLLQRKMNRTEGLTADETLKAAQSLYEKKLITYPRTSSNYLSKTVYQTDVPKVLNSLSSHPEFGRFASVVLKENYGLTSRHVNDSKVTDHHAIIPTAEKPQNLSPTEALLYSVITKRFLAAFFPEGQDEKTAIIVDLASSLFVSKGSVVISPGWRVVENNDDEKGAGGDDDDASLPKVRVQEKLKTEELTSLERQTRPPKRHTDDSILGTMESAGQTIENDEEAKQAMKEFGLGTPATRAEIIETLIKRGYIERIKKQLISTSKAKETIARLSSIDSILVSPALTGKWEAALNRIARNETPPDKFRSTVPELVKKLVRDISGLPGFTFTSSGKSQIADAPDLGLACPKCKAAGRNGQSGNLKTISTKDKRQFIVCTLGRESCGFITDLPKRKGDIKRLSAEICRCGSHFSYRVAKESKKGFLSCATFPACKETIWLDQK